MYVLGVRRKWEAIQLQIRGFVTGSKDARHIVCSLRDKAEADQYKKAWYAASGGGAIRNGQT